MRSLVLLAVLLAPLTARADVLPDGHRAVKLTLKVDADVPAGKALVLANTFEGATVVTPGAVQDIQWHPLHGDMQLRLVSADSTEAIKAAAANLDRDKIKPLVDAGAACGAAFAGERTIEDSSPAVEVRWNFRATITGDTCGAELVKREFLDAGGKAVAAPGAPAQPGPTSAPLADPPKPAPATPTPAEPAAAPNKAAEKSSSMCQIGGDSAPGALLGLGLLLGLRRRRRTA